MTGTRVSMGTTARLAIAVTAVLASGCAEKKPMIPDPDTPQTFVDDAGAPAAPPSSDDAGGTPPPPPPG